MSDPNKFQTEFQHNAHAYASLPDLLQIDPRQTYMGSTFREEKHSFHDIHADGQTLNARITIENDYSNSAHFHLTQIATYSIIGQLGLGYLCYKYGVGKNKLGMATPKELHIVWDGLVTDSKNIPARLEELDCTCTNGEYASKVAFDIGNGVATGYVIGGYTLKAE